MNFNRKNKAIISLSGLSNIDITASNNNASIGIYWSETTTFIEDSNHYATYNSSSALLMSCNFNNYQPNYFKVVALGSSNTSIKTMKISFTCRSTYSTLTVTSSDTSKGTVTGSGNYKIGNTINVSANPALGYAFDGWYDVDDVLLSNDNPYTLTMPNVDLSIYAQFKVATKGDVTKFGTYPQSKVTDTALIATLITTAGALPKSTNPQAWTDYGYYISGTVKSYMWYIDLVNDGSQYRGVYLAKYRPEKTALEASSDNSYQDDNGYNTGTVYFFKYEPISWRVLSIDGSKLFLLANIALDAQDYYYSVSDRSIDGNTIHANNYKESHIRSWLNTNFYETAFSSIEQTKISTTEVDNSVSTTSYSPNKYTCEDTNDKVFLLSYKDVINADYGFNSDCNEKDSARQVKATDYAKSQGIFVGAEEYLNLSRWWLRSPYYRLSDRVGYVDYSGDSWAYSVVYHTSFSPLPALWVSL